jgi:hypothetical protein
MASSRIHIFEQIRQGRDHAINPNQRPIEKTNRGSWIMQTQSKDWNVTVMHIEQIRIVGPVNERNHCLAWLDENGFELIRSGPSDSDQSHPDWIRNFLVIGEKKQDEKMDSQAKNSTVLGIQLKGLNISLVRLLLTSSVIMLIWLIGLTIHLWSLERRLDILQTEHRAGISITPLKFSEG